jgi:hypothetical protein
MIAQRKWGHLNFTQKRWDAAPPPGRFMKPYRQPRMAWQSRQDESPPWDSPVNDICVFVGPTRVRKADYPRIDFFPPAALGSVFRAAERGYRRIGIIDGFFGNTPSVWHKEILHAIAGGIVVAGAASTGALRASELSPYGMHGIGNIYRLYRRASIADDDEVCVTHAIAEMDFLPLSEPMISIRYTLRDLRRRGDIAKEEEAAVAAELKALHFSERTLERIRDAIERHLPPDRACTTVEAYLAVRRDAKGEDAKRLLDWLCAPVVPSAQPQWQFPRTIHWVHQFEDRINDVPKLDERIV